MNFQFSSQQNGKILKDKNYMFISNIYSPKHKFEHIGNNKYFHMNEAIWFWIQHKNVLHNRKCTTKVTTQNKQKCNYHKLITKSSI